MKKAFLHTALLFFVVAILSGCSTEKNTRASRAYHNLTSHYNIYFNGHESLKAGLSRIDQTVEDDFTRILPIFKESYPAAGNAARADMDNAVLKASKLIQVHSITKKPKRARIRTRSYQEFASKEEFNNWIDDSYLLIGRAYYYQHNFGSAVENFSYILRKFPKEEIRYDAMIWLIRSYSELERFPESLELIQLLQSDRNFPGRLDKELARATAHFYLIQKDYPETIKYLDICLKKNFSMKDKARLQFILAQLYRETGDEAKAVSAFAAVKKYNPPFKMAFNAFINAAGMFSEQGDPEKQKKELMKMARDEKYSEFRDQIFFALANLNLRAGAREEAIENLRKSVANSYGNNYQRALSSVTLADLYFADLNYKESQAYYDSAMLVIDEEYPEYDKLEQRFASLTRLVENLTVVEVQDSLQKLANMPEAERNSLIDKWISDIQEKQRQEELIAQAGLPQQGYYQANEYRFGLGRSGEGSGWYFYNPQTVSFGKSQFQQRWGRRKLEDNWRRSNKAIVSEAELEGFADLADSTKAVIREEDPLQRSFYTQDIPLTDSLMAISHDKIRDALYNAGRIFKSDFDDYKNSAVTYEDLNSRYPDNLYLLSVWFDLYDVYELLGDHARSLEYRNLIISRFPDSKYAKFLQNPNYFEELAVREDSLNSLYNSAFRDYKAGRYDQVNSKTAAMKSLEPDSVILSKIEFMETVARGARSDLNNFESLLKKYLSEYPKAEPAPLAAEILGLIQDSTLTDYKKLIDLGYLHEEIKNEELQTSARGENDEFGGKFSYDEDLLHYFVIAFPASANVDINRLKFDIANYNLDHYAKIDFDIEEEKLDANNTLIQVRALDNKENGLIYFRAIIRQPEVFRTLKEIDYVNFISSSVNYRQIISEKSIADYLKFFLKNYSRFIGPDFQDKEQQEESPEELMARARAEDEALKERGTFVRVDVPAAEGEFALKLDTTQNFVLAVKDKNISLRPVLNLMAEFNRDKFRVWNLALQIKQAGDYQYVIAKGIPGYNEGLSYFRQLITNRQVFEPLGTATYRNFIATDRNVDILVEKANVDGYMDFFRTNYIQRAGRVPQPAENSQTPTESTSVQNRQTVPQPQQPAGENVPQSETTGNQETVPDQPAGEVTKAAYAGPYSTSLAQPHSFVLIVPNEGFDKAALLSNLSNFNTARFAGLSLKISELPLDDFRTVINLTGLPDDGEARSYLTALTSNRSIFEPLGNANYRNFIISGDNFAIFLERKNIAEYLDFYKLVYLPK